MELTVTENIVQGRRGRQENAKVGREEEEKEGMVLVDDTSYSVANKKTKQKRTQIKVLGKKRVVVVLVNWCRRTNAVLRRGIQQRQSSK